jgi:hypothetical protein
MLLRNPIADYLPQSMFIRLHPLLKVFHDDSTLDRFPSAAAYGFFFHEFVHFLHNVSTVSGLAGFVNTLELWRCFRQTIEPGGFSVGRATDDHLKTLTAWLDAARRVERPKASVRPHSLTILSVAEKAEASEKSDSLLHALVCDAKVSDERGNSEDIEIRIGTVELLECAAWLLEERLVEAISPSERINPVPIFPYRLVESLADYMVPGINKETVIACVLAALQDADAPLALKHLLEMTKGAVDRNMDPLPLLKTAAARNLQTGSEKIQEALGALDREFAGDGALAEAVRLIVAAMREAFDRRLADPFFEFEIIREIAQGRRSISQVIGSLPICAVLQINDGSEVALRRDILLSVLPEAEEACLRILHCLFHYVGRHRAGDRFVKTEGALPGPCPFFTCCDLPLRTARPEICKRVPWESADSPENGDGKGCWYSLAVRITRPPR